MTTRAQSYSIASSLSRVPVRRASVWRWLGPSLALAFAAGMYANSLVTLVRAEGWLS